MLKEMKSHILEAVGNRPNLMKLACDSIFQHRGWTQMHADKAYLLKSIRVDPRSSAVGLFFVSIRG
jgi:hypothetical protein